MRNSPVGRIGVILTGIVLGMPLVMEAEKRALLVPNGSFESPTTDFVNIRVDGWLKTARPADYPEGGGFLWDQLAGVFRNTPPGSPDYLSNMDGKQALYLFAIPGVGLLKDATSTDSPDSSANSNFPHRFEIGSRYTLRVGVLGAVFGSMPLPPTVSATRLQLGKVHMSDQDIQQLENQFPAVSGSAFAAARQRVLASGQSVLQSQGGTIYEVFPDGHRVAVKQVEPPSYFVSGSVFTLR